MDCLAMISDTVIEVEEDMFFTCEAHLAMYMAGCPLEVDLEDGSRAVITRSENG